MHSPWCYCEWSPSGILQVSDVDTLQCWWPEYPRPSSMLYTAEYGPGRPLSDAGPLHSPGWSVFHVPIRNQKNTIMEWGQLCELKSSYLFGIYIEIPTKKRIFSNRKTELLLFLQFISFIDIWCYYNEWSIYFGFVLCIKLNLKFKCCELERMVWLWVLVF